jgi:hypothetical protein
MSRFTRLAVALAMGWLFFTSPARAVFHLMMVVDVFPGHASAPNAQYVELQMYSAGQNLVGGHAVQVFNAAGTVIGTFTFPANVANGADQASILIATTEAQTLFGVTADLVMTPVINPAGGKVCFDISPIDCVAWGNYTGSPTGVGSPFSPGGLPLGYSAQRKRGADGILNPTDDTGDSATDFAAAHPSPRNNANATGSLAFDFFTVTPCRVVDTRLGGGGPVAAGADRTFTIVGGTCAVPPTARAVSLNVAVTESTAGGNVRLFPAGEAVPVVSTINYAAAQTRANNVVVGLSPSGELTARCALGSTHLILDVNGYFQE